MSNLVMGGRGEGGVPVSREGIGSDPEFKMEKGKNDVMPLGTAFCPRPETCQRRLAMITAKLTKQSETN